jgi:hypothetical protein
VGCREKNIAHPRISMNFTSPKNGALTSPSLSGGASASISVEDFLGTFLSATTERREEAMRVLRGEPVANNFAPEPYLSCQDLAQHLGVSPCTIWRWQIPFHDLGGHRRYRLSEAEAYLASEEFRRRAAGLRAERQHPSLHLLPSTTAHES